MHFPLLIPPIPMKFNHEYRPANITFLYYDINRLSVWVRKNDMIYQDTTLLFFIFIYLS